MNKSQLMAILVLSAGLSACGGDDAIVVECDDGLRFQNREEGKRVVAPEGLDQLDEFAELPVPKADADAAPTPPGRCTDMPPPVK
jgi:hypothetical protein